MNWDKLENLYENAPMKSQLGEKIGCNQSNLKKIIREKKQIDINLLEKIARYFSKNVGFFFNEPNPEEQNAQIKKLEHDKIRLETENNLYNTLISTQKETIEALKETIHQMQIHTYDDLVNKAAERMFEIKSVQGDNGVAHFTESLNKRINLIEANQIPLPKKNTNAGTA